MTHLHAVRRLARPPPAGNLRLAICVVSYSGTLAAHQGGSWLQRALLASLLLLPLAHRLATLWVLLRLLLLLLLGEGQGQWGGLGVAQHVL